MIPRKDAALEMLQRSRAKVSLQDFITYDDPEYIVSPFSREVCAALEAFLSDMQQGLRPVLVIGAPPQHGKSQIVSRHFPAFAFGQSPHMAIGALSYAKDLASDMNRDVQRIMMGEKYARVFPEVSLNSRRVVTIDVEPKRNSETFEIVSHSGRYISQGVGGPLTGKRLDIGIIDDPIKNAAEALSDTIKNGVWNWYISTFLTRLSKNSGQVIMATRWAVDDLSGRIIDSNPRARVLQFPAINEDGQALIPDLHPLEKLIETKQFMSEYFWSALYQQSPIVLGGNIIRDDWWRYYTTPPQISYRMAFGDTAQKTKAANDYSVFQCWGYTPSKQAVLLDQIRGKWEAPELMTHARAFWAKHSAVVGQGALRAFKVEDKVSGTGLIQTLKREGIPMIGIPRSTDKLMRVMDAAPYIESGNVLLPQQAAWLSDFLAECSAFPNGAHDDQIDPMCDAVAEVASGKAEPNIRAL